VNETLYFSFLLTRLKHPCVAPVIGFVFPTDSTPLQTATPYYGGGSLQDVTDKSPEWWTPTVKWKAIAGIALGMMSAYRHRIIHRSLNPNNIHFDDDHCVHIVGFGETIDDKRIFPLKNPVQKRDALAFALIMYDILVDHHHDGVPDWPSLAREKSEDLKERTLRKIPEFGPEFVRYFIEAGLSGINPFERFITDMKNYSFEFLDGADFAEVLKYVGSVEKLTEDL
jgi:serine/threonine protein kinase